MVIIMKVKTCFLITCDQLQGKYIHRNILFVAFIFMFHFQIKYSLIYLQNYGHGAKYFYLPKNRTHENLAKVK